MTAEPQPSLPRQHIRIFYEKGEAIKFISHQDEFRMWERVLRRADLPLLYKQGFHPQPHMQFAAPLGVGFTGVNEPLDVIFSPSLPLDEIEQRIRAKLPAGVHLQQMQALPEKADALCNTLIGADYTILLYAEPGEIDERWLQAQIDNFLAQPEIWRERLRKGEYYTYNLRPLVYELRYEGYDAQCEEHRIFLRVQQREGATGRPDEVVMSLGCDQFARTLRRERLYFSSNPEDLALFACYPVVTQKELTPLHAPRPSGKSRFVQATEHQPAPHPPGRSISERAGDEFI